jgi:hypothetical protein
VARRSALISSVWANAILFQVVWFAAVLGAAHEEPLWCWAALGLLAAQALTTPQWRMDLAFAVVCMAIGFLADSFWAWSGVLDYAGEGLAPGWIVVLWAGTGLALNHSLGWFRARPVVGGIVAGAIAPISYLAGERLGAVVIPSVPALGWIAISWVPVFTILFALAHTLDAHAPDTLEEAR